VYSVVARSFPDGGFHIIRNEKAYLLIRCGPLGMEGVQGHWHYDQLSFELWVDSKPILVDPGWFVYEADLDMLHHFKATRAHNTVTIDGRNQVARDLFIYPPPERPVPRLLKWEQGSKEFCFHGEHRLYGDLPDPVSHERMIHFKRDERSLEIRDLIEGKGTHHFEWNLHFSPQLTLTLHDRSASFRGIGIGGRLLIETASDGRIMQEDGWVALGYGVRQKAPVLRWICENQPPLEVRTRILLERLIE
jgi:hypothetical protein